MVQRLSPPRARTAGTEVDDRPDQLLLVFEFVSGWTLKELLAGRPPDVRQSLDLGVQLVEAISAAHS